MRRKLQAQAQNVDALAPATQEVETTPTAIAPKHDERRGTGQAAAPITESLPTIPKPVTFSTQDGNAVRVLFVAQHPSLLSGWRSVIRQINEDPRFVAKVLLCPFLHPFSSASATLQTMREALIAENISFCTADSMTPEHFRPHVAFVQNPYDETRPTRFKSTALVQAGARLAYIPYGLEMGGGAWNLKAQFDLPVHRHAWRIFARSERHKAMFAKYCRSGNNHVVVTGHPKFDNKPVESTPTDNALSLLAAKAKGRKIVLWTPHFSVTDIPTWSTYKLYHETIFETFAKRQDLFLLVRPHPLFYKSMRDNGQWGEEGETAFRLMLENSGNMALDDATDYQNSFNASSALMTDVGSFLLEYLATDKPLLYLHHPEGLGMNDDSTLIEHLYKAINKKDIVKFVDMIASGEDSYLERRLRAKSDYIFGLNQNIAKNICDSIYSSLSLGDDWSPVFDPTHSDGQLKSEGYWRDSTATYLAPPEYYEKKATILEEQLSNLKNIRNAIDIGCGDGKYSLQIARHAKHVQAHELSANLVAQAQEAASLNNAENITFIQNELDDIIPFEKFDLVSCLGVTSCIIDNLKFIHFLQRLKALAKPGATLMLIDSLSTTVDQFAEDQSGYQACYRSISDYKALITKLGFDLSEEILITEATERQLINKLFIFKANFIS
ncbi:methyltransferase domain-containing protein [Pseudomonas entomophila]|uniref:methyltransferase domain-containing protein n=1 Tax=Pseudomonas entomophila TaxID=312306 RepID=UPI0023D7EBA4|nr:methyltransferase domain-containing protein [Pseudomonas entomophila]MDF0729874.1 methyltransferase domain-containing protein [Pseudomonas entomophila]